MVLSRRTAFLCWIIVLLAGGAGGAYGNTLRISLPPVLEALPIAYAQEWGMFEEFGVSVDLIGITDNQERSTALITGNLDAVMEDVTHAILDFVATQDVLITGGGLSVPRDDGVRRAVLSHASKTFGAATLEDLLTSKQMIGTTYRSDDEYMLDQLLASNGYEEAWLSRYMYFTDMLQLAIWFSAKTVPAAVLPEPYITYISMLPAAGGRPQNIVQLSAFEEIDPLPAVVVFRDDFLTQHPETVRAFYRAYGAAVERMNATPRDELITRGLDAVLGLFFQGADRSAIDPAILDAIEIPYFDPPEPLERDAYENVLAWMREKGYVVDRPPYDAVVDSQYLP